MEEVETYVLIHQNNVTQYITTRPILELCLAMERRPGAHVMMIWWDQAVPDLGQEEIETETEEGEREDDADRAA